MNSQKYFHAFKDFFIPKKINRKIEININPVEVSQKLCDYKEFNYYFKNPKYYDDGFRLEGGNFFSQRIGGTLSVGNIYQTENGIHILDIQVSTITMYKILNIVFILLVIVFLLIGIKIMQFNTISISIIIGLIQLLNNLNQNKKIDEADHLILGAIHQLFSFSEVRVI